MVVELTLLNLKFITVVTIKYNRDNNEFVGFFIFANRILNHLLELFFKAIKLYKFNVQYKLITSSD